MKHIVWCLLLICQCSLAQTDNDADISGNRYLFKDWCNGTVHFTSGRVLNQFKLKFDVFRNQLLLQFEGSTFAAESKINKFVMYPKSKDSMVFRKGFPDSDKGTDNTYYQVLFKDKVTLLRLFARTVVEERSLVVASTKQHRRLEDTEYYYLLHNNTLVLLPGNRNELAAVFPDKKEQITEFITAQQFKMRSGEEYVAVVKKYNELIP
jgi:hypothetical protein